MAATSGDRPPDGFAVAAGFPPPIVVTLGPSPDVVFDVNGSAPARHPRWWPAVAGWVHVRSCGWWRCPDRRVPGAWPGPPPAGRGAGEVLRYPRDPCAAGL